MKHRFEPKPYDDGKPAKLTDQEFSELLEDIPALLRALPEGIQYRRLSRALIVLAGVVQLIDGGTPQSTVVQAYNLRDYVSIVLRALRKRQSEEVPQTQR